MCVGEGSAIWVRTRKMAASNCKPGACLRLLLSVYGRNAELGGLSIVPACHALSIGASAAWIPFILYLQRFQ